MKSCVGAEGVAPSQVVTFLFTDVEGSTRRWDADADADAMRAALAADDQVLCSAIEDHGGFLFKRHAPAEITGDVEPLRRALHTAVAVALIPTVSA